MALEDLDRILPQLVDNGLPGGGQFLVADLEKDEWSPKLVVLLVWHGYLPMGGQGMLLPKIHLNRCLLISPGSVHVGRKVRRRAKGFHLTLDQAWSVVVKSVQEHTFTKRKGDCWLSDRLSAVYQAANSVSREWRREGVAFHSVELWHTASGELVAGEIGYTCGAVYSSCTGFALKERFPGSGSVQLTSLGRWLERCGFEIWDLGMEMDYKLELGGKSVPRDEWARHIRRLRNTAVSLRQPLGEEGEADRLLASDPAGAAARDAPPSLQTDQPSDRRSGSRSSSAGLEGTKPFVVSRPRCASACCAS